MTSDKPVTTSDLYAVLSISRSATADEIRKAYRLKALLLHPDKHSSSNDADRKKATRQFQEVSFAYAILSDEKKKGRYDRTGSVEDLGVDEGDAEALAKYFAELYKGMVTKEKIEEYEEKYVGSVEERGDVLKAYVKCSGDMTSILSEVPFSNCDSEARFLEMIEAAISANQVPSFSKHITSNTKEAQDKRRKKAQKEAKAAEKIAKEMAKSNGNHGNGNNGDTTELQQLLQQRGQKRMQNLVESLEAKYGKKGKSDGKKGKDKARKAKSDGDNSGASTNAIFPDDNADGWEDDAEGDSAMPSEPTEEEFRAIQERLFNKSTTESGTLVKEKGRKSSKGAKDVTTRGTRMSTRNKK